MLLYFFNGKILKDTVDPFLKKDILLLLFPTSSNSQYNCSFYISSLYTMFWISALLDSLLVTQVIH
jgi:hypothetical protein